MQLKEILQGLEYTCLQGNTDMQVSDLVYDSRNIEPGCVFVCLRGANVDGHRFVDDAVKKGAAAIVADREINGNSATVILVPDTRAALAEMSAVFFHHPASELITIGLTGTKGKTTVSCMIKSILEKEGYQTGLIGTLGVVIGEEQIKTENTTPESYEVQKYLRKMVDAGCKCVVMEASSLGLKWHRVDGFQFDYGVFTNFSPDHIGKNEHETIEEYLDCKRKLFRQCKVGIFNLDDPACSDMQKGCTCSSKTFGFLEDADFVASNQSLTKRPGYLGVRFDLNGELNLSVDVAIPGGFSVYNALAAIAVCAQLEVSEESILSGLREVKVKGRVEPVPVPGNYTLLIDYAHNAVSMENILKTLREYKPGRLVTMFGAGGNRARGRRYEMGEISGKLSDLSVITADNSRDEDVMDIIADIKVGIHKTDGKYVVIPDRKEAIRYCIEHAKDHDIIVLAGKGHEDYQEIKGIKRHFDEREIIKEILEELKEV